MPKLLNVTKSLQNFTTFPKTSKKISENFEKFSIISKNLQKFQKNFE